MRSSLSRFLLLAIVAGISHVCDLRLLGQVPPVEATIIPDAFENANQWNEIEGFHAARQELEVLFSRLTSFDEQRDAMFILTNSSFEDQDYEDAFQWANEFLQQYPNDGRRMAVLFVHAVSAFQTKRLEAGLTSFNTFLAGTNNNSRRGAAYFWRAMTKLDRGDWSSAEDDLQSAYHDSLSPAYRDIALMGWALSLERRGAFQDAIGRLEEFLAKYPESQLVSQVKIRLASLSLRTGKPQRTLELLDDAVASTRAQREEASLLRGEADVRLAAYDRALIDYNMFIKEFPDGRFARNAWFGRAWTRVKQRDYAGAQSEFDSLSKGNDWLAYAALYESGILALLQGKPNDGLTRLDTLAERSPYDAFTENAYFQMGMTYYRGKHFRDARREFQLAARLFPESKRRTNSYRMLGETNLALADFSNAQYAFGRVRQLDAQAELLAPSMFQEGVCLYHLGRFKSSAEIFDDYLRRFPRDTHAAEGYVWKGEALYQDYRFGEAERAFLDGTRLFPNNPKRIDAVYGAAWSLFEQKKFSEAASAFERFTTEFPGDHRSLDASLRRADCYFFMGQYDKSSAMYATLASAKTDSRNVEYAAFQLAMSYLQRGESQRGIDQLREFLARFPASLYCEVVQFNIGWEYFSREQYTGALPEFRTVLRKYPDTQLMPRVLFNMGDAFYNLKQYDSAKVYYGRVIKEFPSSLLVTDALNGLQFTYTASGKPSGAIAEIDTFLNTRTLSAPKEELLLRKGDIFFGQGDFASAVHEYQQMLSLNPTPQLQARALHQLGRSYEMENNVQKAITYYEQILKNFPDAEIAPAVSLALGTADIKAKKFKEAAANLEAFDRNYPDSPLLSEARYQKGIALTNVPDKDRALTQFRLIIEKHPNDVFADRSRLQIAQILHDRKEFRAALDTLTDLVGRRSDDIAAEGLVLIGQNYLSMKRTTDALQAFNDVERQYTDFPLMVERARMGLGETYEKLQQRKQARSAYEQVVESGLDPSLKKDAQSRLKRLRR